VSGSQTNYPPQPPVAPPGSWHFPTPTRSTLSNGLELVVYQLPGQHVVAGHLVLPLGLENEERAYEGVATITARTLDEGTREHPGEEFAELLETEGAGFGIDVSLSGIQAVLDVPTTRLESALPLFAEAVTGPALDDADVSRHVQLRLAEIEQAQANSSQLASMAFRAAIYDPTVRASRMTAGEPDTVAAVGPEQVRAFHAERF
jgi:zinc protease